MLLVAYFTSLFLEILLFCHETETAEINPDSKPSNPVVKENHNITLSWTYTLSENIGSATFTNIASGEAIASKFGAGGKTNVVLKFQQRFRAVITNTQAQLSILSAQISDQGKYQFQLQTSPSVNTLTDVVELTVQSAPKFTNVSGHHEVSEFSNLVLFCKASGSPLPNITWIKVSQDGSDDEVLQRGPNSTFSFGNISSADAGTYHCTASNGVGNPVTHSLNVTVKFLHGIVLQSKHYVGRGETAYLRCQIEGYPSPSFTWSPCSAPAVCDKRSLTIPNVQTGIASYSCEASNSQGNLSANTSLIIGGNNIYLRLMITDEECNLEDQSFWKKLKTGVNNVFTGINGYNKTELLSFSCGSIIVDLVLKFNNLVGEDVVISTLRNAIQNGKLGELSINASSIVGIPPVITSTTAPPTRKTTPGSDGNKTLIIVLSVIGGVLFLVLVAVVVVCCIRMKNKKDSREVDDHKGRKDGGQPSGPPPGAPGQNNTGYEEPGYANTSSAARTKKDEKKPSKKKDAQQEEMPMYAQVDKSKKKPKPNSYSEVERPDRREPEIQYAVMDHSHPGGSMPRGAATQPRRAPETVYADLV